VDKLTRNARLAKI